MHVGTGCCRCASRAHHATAPGGSGGALGTTVKHARSLGQTRSPPNTRPPPPTHLQELQHRAHTLIGEDIDGTVASISGGERRRVSVGIGLVTDPRVMFLDEPTTGLDSDSALSLVTLLKRLATRGRTVRVGLLCVCVCVCVRVCVCVCSCVCVARHAAQAPRDARPHGKRTLLRARACVCVCVCRS